MSCVIQQFQTLIVGTVGFVGVISTLLVNAYLDRRRHTRQVQHDAKVLRVAIRAELEVLRDALAGWLAEFETLKVPEGESDFMTPFHAMTEVYVSQIGSLGLLSDHEIRAILRAYIPIRQLPETLRLLEQSHLTKSERERGSADHDGRYAAGLRQIHQSCLQAIEAALSVVGI